MEVEENGHSNGYPKKQRINDFDETFAGAVTAASLKASELKVDDISWRGTLEFAVNGRQISVDDAQPHHTLLWFLRERLRLTGTKLGCGEGGCGACTVTVSHFDQSKQEVVHRSVNACLAPLCSVDGCHVTTVEGIGTSKAPHPVQKRIAELHGSQCGFCTPGIVMSLYSTLCRTPEPTLADIESSFDGNLCRCTGYRPILDAAKTFCSDKHACPSAPCDHQGQADKSEQEGDVRICGSTSATIASISSDASLVGAAQVPFPKALCSESTVAPLKIVGKRVTWYRPTDLSTLLALKQAFPSAKLVAGNTEVGIETKFKHCDYSVQISTSGVVELQNLAYAHDGSLVIGGAVSLSRVEHFCEKAVHAGNKDRVRWLKAILDMLRWFASSQIRNVAALAGNIATASPISDMNPVLMALGASVSIASAGNKPREVLIRDFFKRYRVTDLQPHEIICAIKVPAQRDRFEFVQSYKQARRRDDDISIVNACFRILLKPSEQGWIVEKAYSAFGGMAPMTVRAGRFEAALEGTPWNEETLEKASNAIAEDLPLPEGVPGGMAAYRQTLTLSFFYKFYVAVSLELAEMSSKDATLPKPPAVPLEESSASHSFLSEDRPLTHGSQSYVIPSGGLHHTAAAAAEDHAPAEENERAPVGQPLAHRSALAQCTGQATYVDDIALHNPLHAVFILSERPHATIESMDLSQAENVPGVVRIFTAADISEYDNAIGPAIKDEQLFRSHKVTSVGQALGVVVAETLEAAERASRLVKVSYTDLEPVITIEDAIRAKTFHPVELKIEDGNINAAFAMPDTVIVEGEIRLGGQEHFYLECNAAVAEPGDNDELTIHASTQTTMKTQKFAAQVCGLNNSKVVVRVKRMGGGFGGKETRTVMVSSAVAFAAHHLKRTVKMSLDRDVDMLMTGTRHPFIGRYRVGAGPDGKFRALDLKLYSNAGYSLDLSEPVMGRALFHSDGCYKIPNVRVEGFICMTNTASNTAFRGFGAPQGLLIAEAWLEHLASTLKMSPFELRERNMYGFEGEVTHFAQALNRCPLQRLWSELASSSSFSERKVAVAEFNSKNRWRKRGLAMMPTKFGVSFTATFFNQAGALVHVYTDGTVLVTHGGTEMGQGLHTKVIQIAAQALGIPLTDVDIRESATDTVPNASPTAASASSDLYGMAVLSACEQIKLRLRPYLEKHNGNWKGAVNAAYFDRVDLSAHGFYKTPGISYDWKNPKNTERGMPFNYFTYGAAATEVEIDVLTGDMRITRADILMDVGNSLNPAIDIGQIEGAFTQGFGYAMIEETIWGCSEFPWLKPGTCFTRGPGTYKIPSFNDVPIDMRVTLLKDSANPRAIHSSRAIGEPPFVLGAVSFFAAREAIRSARKDAGLGDGHFFVDMPLTPERLRLACGDKIASQFSSKSTRSRPSAFV